MAADKKYPAELVHRFDPSPSRHRQGRTLCRRCAENRDFWWHDGWRLIDHMCALASAGAVTVRPADGEPEWSKRDRANRCEHGRLKFTRPCEQCFSAADGWTPEQLSDAARFLDGDVAP